MIAAVLEGLGPVHQTNGNFNNHIGVPKTITDASGNESAWVLEMGMSALGEIHLLQEIGEPNIRIITNIEPLTLKVVEVSKVSLKQKASCLLVLALETFVVST